MSLASTRQAVATACSTVTGLTGYVYPPGGGGPGDAWAQLITLDPRPLASAQWSVVVVLGQDLETAERFLDGLVTPLVAALTDVDFLCTEVRPGTLSVGGASFMAAEFVGRRAT